MPRTTPPLPPAAPGAGSLGLLALAPAILAVPACAPAAQRPNVALVVVDTLRADHLGCYGYERDTSPRLDQLAAEGLRFERALAQAPWTTPSVAALMTSLHPTTLGIGSERSVLADEFVLLPEILAEAGYRTGAVISHTFCSARWNFDQGFDWFDQSNIGGHAVVTSEGVTARALEFVDWTAGEPFFLWAHYFDPHFFYVEHAAHTFGGAGDYAGPIEPGLEYTQLLGMLADLTEADLRELIRIYDSEIAHTDRWIGALFDGLRARGLWEDTLVIVTGDHGEEFLDHGDLGHARTLYRELINVPLIVKLPRGRQADLAGSVVSEHVALLDVFPTVLQVAGLRCDEAIEGRSLLGPRDPQRAIVSETARQGGVRSLVSGDYKLIRRVRDERFELYHLGRDSDEQEDLLAGAAAQAPGEARRLKESLRAWEAATLARAASELQLSPEELEALRQLGYAGADEDH